MSSQKKGKAPKKARESADMEAMVMRVMAALVRRAGEGDTEAMAALVRLETQAGHFTVDAARELRAEPWNYSWADIGNALGVTRQAAQQRFGGPCDVEDGMLEADAQG